MRTDMARRFAAGALLLSTVLAACSGAPPSPTPTPPGGIVQIPAATGAVLGDALGPDGTVYLSVAPTPTTFEILAVDPASGHVLTTVPETSATSIAFAAGSVWAYAVKSSCGITRLDPKTLAVVATAAIDCSVAGPGIAGTSDAVWYVDLTGTAAGGHPAHLRRVDPTTNAIDKGIDVPDGIGHLLASDTDVFFADEGVGTRVVYKLAAGATSVVSLGNLLGPVLYPAGDGIWVKDLLDAGVSRYVVADKPETTLSVEGTAVAGDGGALYVERIGTTVADPDELWRYPATGSAPTRVAVAGSVTVDATRTALFYGSTGTALLVGPHRLVAIWSELSNSARGGVDAFVQSVALP
jgi:hypothetical protein